jgi:hypothetical protein
MKHRHALDLNGAPQFGLIAGAVDQVDPDRVARDNKNQVYSVQRK